MKFRYAVTKDTDVAYWVDRQLFFSNFDQDDFFRREVINVDSHYLTDWIHKSEQDIDWFYIPTVHLVSGRTQFINGRHRTAVLYGLIDSVPMAFAEGDARLFAEKLGLPKLASDALVELPDLPILKADRKP